MDENKAAAAAEVTALAHKTEEELGKLRASNAHQKREYAKDLTKATEAFYEKLAASAKADADMTEALNAETQAAKIAAENDLGRAEDMFSTKIECLSNLITSNAATAESGITHLT